jgi:hypothetical protein
MMAAMMGATSAPSALASEMSVLRALARLLDPEAGEEIEPRSRDFPTSPRRCGRRPPRCSPKVRDMKNQILARDPNILRKASAVRGSTPEPSWRGLPVDNIAADTFAKQARSRAAEEQRLAKEPAR